jgi:hypothetical protein
LETPITNKEIFMGATNDCLYCVSEITDGFRFNGEVDMRVWEKSLSLTLCEAGAAPARIGSIVLELRFLIFLYNVSKALGMKPGDCVTNPEVIDFIHNLFIKGLMPSETASRTKAQFPRFPWKEGGPTPANPPADGVQNFSL